MLLCKQLLASYKKSSKSIENNLADIKKSVDKVKTAISPTPNTEAKYSDIIKNSYVPESNALASEIRVSGIPEDKSLSNDRNRKLDIFDHEVSVHKVLSPLDVTSSDTVSMSRLGKFNAAKSRPRTLLVKFRKNFCLKSFGKSFSTQILYWTIPRRKLSRICG